MILTLENVCILHLYESGALCDPEYCCQVFCTQKSFSSGSLSFSRLLVGFFIIYDQNMKDTVINIFGNNIRIRTHTCGYDLHNFDHRKSVQTSIHPWTSILVIFINCVMISVVLLCDMTNFCECL